MRETGRALPFDPAAVAGEIARAFAPARTFVSGEGAELLVAALAALGCEAGVIQPGGAPRFENGDLLVCLDGASGIAAVETGNFETSPARIIMAAAEPFDGLRRAAALGYAPEHGPELYGFGIPVLAVCRSDEPPSEARLAAAAEAAVLRSALSAQARQIARLERDVAQLHDAVRSLETCSARRTDLARLARSVEDIAQSRIWRALKWAGGIVARMASLGDRRSPWTRSAPAATRAAAEAGDAYAAWIERNEIQDQANARARVDGLISRPGFAVVMPVFQPDPADLESAIASVRAQSYPNWHLVIACDGPQPESVRAALAAHEAADRRIRLVQLAQRSGISAAANAALAAAVDEYVGFLDQDDELAPDALLSVAERIDQKHETDVLYSDEDHIDPGGPRRDPFFKPDWSPDLLLSMNYVCHFLVVRRALLAEAGGLRSEFDGSQDYDLMLRLMSLTGKIEHIPKVLYHWRASAASVVRSSGAKPWAYDAGRRALEDHIRRNQIDARVEDGIDRGRYRVRYAIPRGFRATILIPSGGKTEHLTACLESVLSKTAYPDHDILLIDNSSGAEVRKIAEALTATARVRYLDWRNKPFNYSRMMNAGAAVCDSPGLVFLNDDTEIKSPEWLESLIELGARPEVGIVGAKLVYPNGAIQHAGIVMGVWQLCAHAFHLLDSRQRHYFDLPDVIRNVSAVTGACMFIRRDVFRELGGFDEAAYPIVFNDIDLCLRAGERGYRVLYTPHALVVHHESLTRRERGLMEDEGSDVRAAARWSSVIGHDPFYSPHLTRDFEDYSIRR